MGERQKSSAMTQPSWRRRSSWPLLLCAVGCLRAAAFFSPPAAGRKGFAGGQQRQVERVCRPRCAAENFFSDGGYGSLQPATLADSGKGVAASIETDWARATWGYSAWSGIQAGIAVVSAHFADFSVAPLIMTAVCCSVLRSAASRDRLNGGTFRTLGLAVLGASTLFLLKTIMDVSVLVRLLGQRPVPLETEGKLLAQVPLALVAWFGCKAGYGTLHQHGLPKFKLSVRAERGQRWLLTLLAVGYAVTAVHQVVWGSAALFSGPFTLGALRCFIVAACAHVCQTAAVAGPKRLSSETYRTLNLALILDGVARLAILVATADKPPALLAGVLVFPAVDLVCALGGWAVGKYYKA
ncbi:unnamed protein product [Effrenium voratum]|nr:unnamed protein product [Effrenium voratum]